jgi:hypothetical protein
VAGVQGASASGLSGRAIARELAAGIVADYSREQERGVACFMDDFEACIAHLRFLVTHRRAIRTTNLLERWSGGASRSFPMPSVNARSRK